MKKQVNFSILRDMQKYIPDVNAEEFDSSFSNDTDESVINDVKNYYDSHLPVDITAWIRVNEPDKNLIYGKKLKEQVSFVRDVLFLLITKDSMERRENPVMVISTHVSKNVKLPVYQINLKEYGMEIILRSNFYNWKISVNSEKPVECDFIGLFDPKKEISYFDCEGFPEDKVYGSYESNHSRFTFEIVFFQNVYVFFYLLKNYLGINKK